MANFDQEAIIDKLVEEYDDLLEQLFVRCAAGDLEVGNREAIIQAAMAVYELDKNITEEYLKYKNGERW
jgi:hypothetical protein